jgi:hypothetical protein
MALVFRRASPSQGLHQRAGKQCGAHQRLSHAYLSPSRRFCFQWLTGNSNIFAKVTSTRRARTLCLNLVGLKQSYASTTSWAGQTTSNLGAMEQAVMLRTGAKFTKGPRCAPARLVAGRHAVDARKTIARTRPLAITASSAPGNFNASSLLPFSAVQVRR